jgi:hypothetical protein
MLLRRNIPFAEVRATTVDLCSQSLSSQAGFVPLNMMISPKPDENKLGKVTVGMYRLFAPVDQGPIYIPVKYATLAHSLLTSYDVSVVEVEGQEHTEVSDYVRKIVAEPDAHQAFMLNLTSPAVEPEVTLLERSGFYFSGFFPYLYEGSFRFCAIMRREHKITFEKDDVNLIPEAQGLFDTVWDNVM